MKEYLRTHKNQLLYISVIFAWILSMAFSSNPPNGRTGAPGEGLCSDCHNQAGNPPQDGNLMIDFPTTIEASQTYTITIMSNNPNGLAQRGGFQMTILDSNNDVAGSMMNPSASSVVTPSAGREYHEHNPAQNYPASNSVSWTVDWTAPAGPDMEQISWYAAGIVANGANGNSGDLLVQSTGTRTLTGVGGDPLMASVSDIMNVLCFNDNTGSAEASATGGLMPYTFAWSNGDMNALLGNVGEGVYTVTVTDSDNSTATAQASITQPDEIFASGIVTNATCNGDANGSINAIGSTGGIPPLSFSWSNGINNAINPDITAGSYTLTITDDNNCTSTMSFQVNEPMQVQVDLLSSENLSCNGDDSGEASFEATGGIGGFTYEWSNGFFGPSQSGLASDTYTITATDGNGCTNESIVEITEPVILELTQEIVDDALCFDSATGGIEVSAAGGVGNLQIDWSNGQSGNTILNLLADTYTATVTDANGCADVLAVTVGQPDELLITIESQTPISCSGANDASITISILGGTPDATPEQYSIIWSDGNSGLSNSNLPPGMYTIDVMDVNVCQASINFEITDPLLLVGQIMSTDETVPGGNDGTASIVVSGGVTPYTYLWSNGASTSDIMNLGTGNYTVTATDANGCTITEMVTIMSAGCVLSATITTTDVDCFGALTGAATLIIMNQVDPVTILWSTAETTNMISSISAGGYAATITDGTNCTFTVSGTVNQPSEITVNCNSTDETMMGTNDGTASCAISGGTPPYSYMWSNNATTDSISNLSPGNYTLTITDANECTTTSMVAIIGIECALSYEIVSLGVSCFGAADGTAFINIISGATEPIQYLWSNGAMQDSLVNLDVGTYVITATDNAGCSIIDSVTIFSPTNVMAQIDSVTNTSNGVANGQIFITPSGGVPPYTFSWLLNNQEISTDQNPDSLLSGLYQVNIIDANGCVGSQSDIQIQGSTSVLPVDNSIWKLYPNPAENNIWVELVANKQTLQLKEINLYDLDGRVLENWDVNHFSNQQKIQLSLDKIVTGMFILEIKTSEFNYVKRIVKN